MFISCVNFRCYWCSCITKATNKLLFPLCCMYCANTSVVTVFELFVALTKTHTKKKTNWIIYCDKKDTWHIFIATSPICQCFQQIYEPHHMGVMREGRCFLLENFVPTLFPHTLNDRGSWTCISMLFECPTLMLERLFACLHCTTLLKE